VMENELVRFLSLLSCPLTGFSFRGSCPGYAGIPKGQLSKSRKPGGIPTPHSALKTYILTPKACLSGPLVTKAWRVFTLRMKETVCRCGGYKGKVVPMLKELPCHEDVWGSGGIAPRILNLGTRWR
jgi:hypothetical protein